MIGICACALAISAAEGSRCFVPVEMSFSTADAFFRLPPPPPPSSRGSSSSNWFKRTASAVALLCSCVAAPRRAAAPSLAWPE